MKDGLISILEATAWTIEKPAAYTLPVIALTAAGILTAAAAAYRLAGRRPAGQDSSPALRVLVFCGLLLALAEGYKQTFLYFIVFQGSYNWWYFPFQLCSVPMYLCLALPLFPKGTIRQAILVFLRDFGLLGGIMALLVPEGFLWEYVSLTAHGFLWHFLLIFIGCYIGFSRIVDTPKPAGLFSALPVYFICCLIATAVNLAVQAKFWPYSYANMFYINPCFPSEQAVFHTIALTFGTPVGLAAYLLATVAGALLIHRFWDWLKPE